MDSLLLGPGKSRGNGVSLQVPLPTGQQGQQLCAHCPVRVLSQPCQQPLGVVDGNAHLQVAVIAIAKEICFLECTLQARSRGGTEWKETLWAASLNRHLPDLIWTTSECTQGSQSVCRAGRPSASPTKGSGGREQEADPHVARWRQAVVCRAHAALPVALSHCLCVGKAVRCEFN